MDRVCIEPFRLTRRLRVAQLSNGILVVQSEAQRKELYPSSVANTYWASVFVSQSAASNATAVNVANVYKRYNLSLPARAQLSLEARREVSLQIMVSSVCVCVCEIHTKTSQ